MINLYLLFNSLRAFLPSLRYLKNNQVKKHIMKMESVNKEKSVLSILLKIKDNSLGFINNSKRLC
tara:strand:- start:935 stop:1129 length:195 start_codon:yes stop_codon:yes gene_type:complete